MSFPGRCSIGRATRGPVTDNAPWGGRQMSTRERKEIPAGRPRDPEPPAAGGTAEAQAKKAYRKPVLSKYEQLHGIGLGSPD